MEKKGLDRIKTVAKSVAMGAVATFVATSAHATIDLSSFSLDLAPVETLIPIVLGGGAVIWVGRKLIKFINKS